jgi:phytoene/squalene synthetase
MVRRLPRSDRRQAAKVTRGKARSFYLASLFLPSSARREVHTLYAFYRMVDDLVDEPPEGMGRQDILRVLSDSTSM